MSQFKNFNSSFAIQYMGPSKRRNAALFMLLDSFSFKPHHTTNEVVIVPVGYITDGATIPPVFWSIMPPWGTYGKAAILHDYLIEYGKIFTCNNNDNHYRTIDRNEARLILYQALTELSIPTTTRYLLVSGVWIWDTWFKFKNKINSFLYR